MAVEKIYTVNDGKVISARIEKETPKLYWVERSKAFSFCRNHIKEHACITPQEAVMEEYNKAISRVNLFEEKLREAQSRLTNALLLKKEYNK